MTYKEFKVNLLASVS